MNNDHIGKLAEMQFDIECAKRELICSWPSIDKNGYDCIVDSGSLLKVQIKSTMYTRKDPKRNEQQYKIMVQKGKSGKDAYSKNDFNILAVYIHPTNDWYFIPYLEIHNRCISINPKSNRSKYIKYKNNWDYLSSSS